MSEKTNSMGLIVGGLILILLSLSADLIRLGGDMNAFGWKQITGTGVGLLLLLIGLWLRIKKTKNKSNH